MKNFLFLVFLFIGVSVLSQTTIWETGFETGDSSPTVSITSSSSSGVQTTGGNLSPMCWRIVSTPNPGKTYDGSLITPLLNLNSSKFYRATVYARIGATSGGQAYFGTLKIVKSTTATNVAMKSANGSDVILDEGTNNVNSLNYIKFQVNFTVTSNESKYIGFQMFNNASANQFMQIDDIKIEESDSPFVPVHCKSQASSMTYSFISNVTFNTINNTSTNNKHYTDFSHISTTVIQGMSYNLTITKNNTTNSTQYQGRFRAWIDWNQDGDFDDLDELVLTDNLSSNGPLTNSVLIPSHSLLGKTIMRCIFIEGSVVPSSCGVYSTWGETEDYMLFIEEPTSLPVTLTSFTSDCENGIPLLKWTTESEQNSDYFQIERSRDGIYWTEVSKVQAMGNSNTTKNYQFYDMTSGGYFEGYYRLKQVDFDGKFEYFDPIYVFCEKYKSVSNVEVFPNPTNKNLHIGVKNSISDDGNIIIMDLSGKIVHQENIELNNGYNLVNLDIETLSKGVYVIKILSTDIKHIEKIIKQ